MKKQIVILLLKTILLATAIVSTPSAWAESKPVNVVEVASFYCGNCYAVKQQIMPLIRAVEKTGGLYHFVPVGLDADQNWSAMAYLGTPAEKTSGVAEALYKSVQDLGMNLDSAASACNAISNYMREYDPDTCLENALSDSTMTRQDNVFRLMDEIVENHRANFVFPLFLIQQDGEIKRVLSFGDYDNATQLLDEVARQVKSYGS